MSDTTKNRLTNELMMLLFTLLLGAAAGTVIWLFLKGTLIVTDLLWVRLPAAASFPAFSVFLCAAGGLLIGLVHKFSGDYPEELPRVLAKLKKDKYYDYKPMASMLAAAFLPLVFGASAGPEAGMTGIIAGLCSWVGDNIKFARVHKEQYNEIGAAVTLGVIFHAPLFGIFSVEEERTDASDISLPKPAKLVLYSLSIAAGFLAYSLLGKLFGPALEGIEGFDSFSAGWLDYLLVLLYILTGILLCILFEKSEALFGTVSGKIPVIVREILAGLVIGATAMIVPMVLFSGEEELGRLIENYGNYAPMFLIGIALLKVIMTAFSIKFGFKGGHFFPLIFACVSMGFGLTMLFFTSQLTGHAAFAAGMVTAAALGAQMKKPLAVSMLMLLVFPVRMLLFVFVAAALSGRLVEIVEKKFGKE